MNPVLRGVGLAVVVVVLAGCSTPSEPDDRVATLETTGSTPPSVSSTSPAAARPRERLDMTPDELEEMDKAYVRCLAENGYDTGRAKEEAARTPGDPSPADQAAYAAAEAACVGEKPLPPWEYDLLNPESSDFVHAVVQCLRDKGVRYVEESQPAQGEDRRGISLGGPTNDSESISKGLTLLSTCEKESAHK
jgi:hypothetical protein